MLVPFNTNTRARCTGDDESAPKTRDSTRRRCNARSRRHVYLLTTYLVVVVVVSYYYYYYYYYLPDHLITYYLLKLIVGQGQGWRPPFFFCESSFLRINQPRSTRSAPKAWALRAPGRLHVHVIPPDNCARCLLVVGMSKTSCASRCSKRSVQGALRAPAEGEGGEGWSRDHHARACGGTLVCCRSMCSASRRGAPLGSERLLPRPGRSPALSARVLQRFALRPCAHVVLRARRASRLRLNNARPSRVPLE